MVQSGGSFLVDQSALPPPVGPCIDPSNLALAIFGAVFGTLLLCTAFAFLFWYLMRTDKFQFADKLLVLERGLLGKRGGRRESGGGGEEEREEEKKREGGTKRTGGSRMEETEETIGGRGTKWEVKRAEEGNGRESERTNGRGITREEEPNGGQNGRENGRKRHERGGMLVEEEANEVTDIKGTEEKNLRKKIDGNGATEEKNNRETNEKSTTERMQGKEKEEKREATEWTEEKGKEETGEKEKKSPQDKKIRTEGIIGVGKGEEEHREEMKVEKEPKKQWTRANGKGKDEESQMTTNGGRIRQNWTPPQQTTERSPSQRGEEEEKTATEDGTEEEQKRHSTRLMAVLSADQFGTLEMNRRRLETERRQLREMGVI